MTSTADIKRCELHGEHDEDDKRLNSKNGGECWSCREEIEMVVPHLKRLASLIDPEGYDPTKLIDTARHLLASRETDVEKVIRWIVETEKAVHQTHTLQRIAPEAAVLH